MKGPQRTTCRLDGRGVVGMWAYTTCWRRIYYLLPAGGGPAAGRTLHTEVRMVGALACGRAPPGKGHALLQVL